MQNDQKIEKEYKRRKEIYERLKNEVVFILEKEIHILTIRNFKQLLSEEDLSS